MGLGDTVLPEGGEYVVVALGCWLLIVSVDLIRERRSGWRRTHLIPEFCILGHSEGWLVSMCVSIV